PRPLRPDPHPSLPRDPRVEPGEGRVREGHWYVGIRNNRVEQLWPITARGAVYRRLGWPSEAGLLGRLSLSSQGIGHTVPGTFGRWRRLPSALNSAHNYQEKSNSSHTRVGARLRSQPAPQRGIGGVFSVTF